MASRAACGVGATLNAILLFCFRDSEPTNGVKMKSASKRRP
jgi:hypothetical protein